MQKQSDGSEDFDWSYQSVASRSLPWEASPLSFQTRQWGCRDEGKDLSLEDRAPTGRRARILIVDDKPEEHDVLCALLVEEGYEVSVSPCRGEKLEKALRRDPDLAIVELPRGERESRAILRELRRGSGLVERSIIALAAEGCSWHIRQGMETGADDCLAQPATPDGLLRAVRSRLARRHRAERHHWGLLRFVGETMPCELRAPLTGILGFAELLREDMSKNGSTGRLSVEAMHSYSDHLLRSSQQLRDTVERCLLWVALHTRLTGQDDEGGPWTNAWSLANLVQTLRCRAVRHGRERDLRLEIAPAALEAFSGKYLARIVSLIVDNAFKYSYRGQMVSVEGRAVAGRYEVSVFDQGRGFPESVMTRLATEAGSPVEDCLSPGLGLAMVRRFAALVDGQLEIASAPMGGETRVTLCVPLAVLESTD